MFYLREYPKVVGLLHGLLGSRLVAEELAQVDAAGRLREIVRRTDQPVTHGRTAVLLDQPWEPELAEASLVPPAPPRRRPQRLALVVNLLLVLGIGVLLGGAASYVLDTDGAAPASSANTAPASSASAITTGPAGTRGSGGLP